MKPFICLTIATASHLCRCEVLFESLKKFHPEALCVAFLIDEWPDGAPPNDLFKIESVTEMGLEALSRRMFRYTGYERASSLKAAAMQRALELFPECSIGLFFDADIEFFAPLSPILDALNTANICLTPHLIDTNLQHGGWKTASKFGIFNGGFFGVRRSPETTRFLNWMDERLVRECYNDVPEGAFNDQRWFDHVPALFDGVVSCRHPGLNVAYWNLGERRLSGSPEAPIVNGERVIFYHYSGWSPLRPSYLSHYQGPSAAPVPEESLLGRLLKNYLEVTEQSIYFRWLTHRCAYDTYRDGRPIDEMDHIYYSEFLQKAMPSECDPYDGLPNSVPLTWVRLVGRVAWLIGYRIDGKRQFLLYRWTRRLLEIASNRGVFSPLHPSRPTISRIQIGANGDVQPLETG